MGSRLGGAVHIVFGLALAICVVWPALRADTWVVTGFVAAHCGALVGPVFAPMRHSAFGRGWSGFAALVSTLAALLIVLFFVLLAVGRVWDASVVAASLAYTALPGVLSRLPESRRASPHSRRPRAALEVTCAVSFLMLGSPDDPLWILTWWTVVTLALIATAGAVVVSFGATMREDEATGSR